MTRDEQDLQALNRCCLGNREAMEFLLHWRAYVHAIDDIIDGDADSQEDILAAFAQAPMLFSHPFYVKNMAALRQLVLNCTNAYADSVVWEKSAVKWQREFSDHYRHFGAEMVLAVASICAGLTGKSGYDHMRSISRELRTICWHEHHTPAGEPI